MHPRLRNARRGGGRGGVGVARGSLCRIGATSACSWSGSRCSVVSSDAASSRRCRTARGVPLTAAHHVSRSARRTRRTARGTPIHAERVAHVPDEAPVRPPRPTHERTTQSHLNHPRSGQASSLALIKNHAKAGRGVDSSGLSASDGCQQTCSVGCRVVMVVGGALIATAIAVHACSGLAGTGEDTSRGRETGPRAKRKESGGGGWVVGFGHGSGSDGRASVSMPPVVVPTVPPCRAPVGPPGRVEPDSRLRRWQPARRPQRPPPSTTPPRRCCRSTKRWRQCKDKGGHAGVPSVSGTVEPKPRVVQ